MSYAYVALGFGMGVLASGVVAVVALGVAGVMWYRACRAFERAGFDLSVKGPSA